jgi:hypothetical protein
MMEQEKRPDRNIKMEALLHLISKTEFHILECEQLAKDLGCFNKMTFELVGPTGRMECTWLDAYIGTFRDYRGRVFQTRQFVYVSDVHVENIGGFE